MASPRLYIAGYDTVIRHLPAAFNWLGKNKVTPAKDQGHCAGSWAYATTAVFESKILVAGGPFYDFSEQQQLSCNPDMKGCCGGDCRALRFWETNGPVLESAFPNSELSSECSTMYRKAPCDTSWKEEELPFRLDNYYTIDVHSNESIKASIYCHGPAMAACSLFTDFDTFYWQGRRGEVYTQTDEKAICRGGHAVAVIGWDDDKAAWLCKNSWGAYSGPEKNGTFWIAYSGHTHNFITGICNSTLIWQPFYPVTHETVMANDPRYSGSAVASMIINKLAGIEPIDSIRPVSQTRILNFVKDYFGPLPATGANADILQSILAKFTGDGYCSKNTDGEIDGDSCAAFPVNGRYSWELCRSSDVNALLYNVAYWQYKEHFTAAIPLKGDYRHWAAIEGVQSDLPPSDLPYPDEYPDSLRLFGFFIDDPSKDNVRAKSFQPAARFVDPGKNFFKPTSGDRYEAITEPAPIQGVIVAAACSSETRTFSPGIVARQRILQFRLISNRDFSTAYRQTDTGTAIFVTCPGGEKNFFLVPFVKPSDRRVSIIVRLDGATGELLEAVYNPNSSLGFPIDPMRTFPPSLKFFWGPGYRYDECRPLIAGDLNGDGKVDNADRTILLRALGACRGKENFCVEADYNSDGCITADDLSMWERYYGYYRTACSIGGKDRSGKTGSEAFGRMQDSKHENGPHVRGKEKPVGLPGTPEPGKRSGDSQNP